MNRKLLSVLPFLAATPALLAQVGIGTATPHSSAQLEVKSTTKGLLPPRVELQGTDDISTILGPAAGLIVYNQTPAGSGSKAVTKGIYNFDGSAWVPMNNTPTASTTLPVVGSTSGGASSLFIQTFDLYTQSQEVYYDDTMGMSITLPPGKWQVKIGVRIIGGNFVNGPWPPDSQGSFAHRFYLKDQDVMMGPPRWTRHYAEFSPLPGEVGITADTIPGMASVVEKDHDLNAVAKGNFNRSLFIEGSIWINNSGASAKTYYLFHTEDMYDGFLLESFNVSGNPTGLVYPIGGISSNGQGANYIVAYPHATQ